MWITFEGIEGSGKSTQIARLADRLRRADIPTVVTREPGGTETGRKLRAILLRPSTKIHPMTELLLYAADRAEHLYQVVLPARERGEVVLCDRFLDATLAYQGYGRRLGTDRILELHRRSPLDRRPDRTLLFDLDPEIGLRRARDRNSEQGTDATEGRFEQELMDFHNRVRHGYLDLARGEPGRFRIVDAAPDADHVERAVLDELADLLPRLADTR
ncbi:MAG: dTMP kinase [bacterium]|nr:dTMP kinase [bacterium]